jgi:hypothetical protein
VYAVDLRNADNTGIVRVPNADRIYNQRHFAAERF